MTTLAESKSFLKVSLAKGQTENLIHMNSIRMKNLSTCAVVVSEVGHSSSRLTDRQQFPTNPIVGYKLQNREVKCDRVRRRGAKKNIEYGAIACS